MAQSVRQAWLSWLSTTLAMLSVGYGLWTVVHSASHLPVQDQWEFIFAIAQHDGGLSWSDLWAPHNEHRIVVLRLLFLGDLWLTGGRSDSIVALHVILLALFGIALARLAGLHRHAAGRFLALCLGLLLSAADCILITEPILIGFTLVMIGVAAAVWCSEAPSLARIAGGREVAAILCASFATASSAQGLAVWPLLCLIAVLRGHRRSAIAAYFIAGVVSISLYFWHYPVLGNQGSAIAIILTRPFAILRFVALFLAGPVGQVNAELGRIWGCLLIGATAILAWRCWQAERLGEPWPSGRVTLLAMAAFLIGCGLLAAVTRLDTTPRPPRYSAMAITFALCLTGLWANELALVWHRVRPATIVSLITAGIVAATILYAPRQAREAYQRHAALAAASDALRSGSASDENLAAIAAIAPDASSVWATRGFLIAHRLTIFADLPE